MTDHHNKFGTTIRLHPWVDPVVDAHGHDPLSAYVERFWLPVLGPTATLLLRRLTRELLLADGPVDLDLEVIAKSMGLSYGVGRSSPFSKALYRLAMFGLAQVVNDHFGLRTSIPDVARRHLLRLPAELQAEHELVMT